MEIHQPILKILCTISLAEQELENYRQLLNEEITFNLTDLTIAVNRGSTATNAIILSNFLNTGSTSQRDYHITETYLESVIRFYNDNSSLNMSFVEFSCLFLSRENKLLAKMVLERPQMGAIPGYLLNFARKIIICQAKLHQNLIQFRYQYGKNVQNWIKSVMETNLQTFIDQSKLRQFCGQQLNCELLLRYLKILSNSQVPLQSIRTLLTLKNSNLVTNFIKSKQMQTNSQKLFRTGNVDPYIRPQFHDCLRRPKLIENFSFRQVRSIQKHLERINVSHKLQLTQKIQRYRSCVERQVEKVCKAIKEIILIEKQTEYARVQLCLCADFYPILFFNSFDLDRNERIIPSSMQNYLKVLGHPAPLKKLYLLFKRFSAHEDGKMSFNSFCSIFDVCNSNNVYTRIDKNRKVKSLEDISVDTKRAFMEVIRITAENQYKLEKIKCGLLKGKNVDLRDVFSCVDMDDRGKIDEVDFRVMWKRFLGLDISSDEIDLFWLRIKGRPKVWRNQLRDAGDFDKEENSTNYNSLKKPVKLMKSSPAIEYEEFIHQLSPKMSFKK